MAQMGAEIALSFCGRQWNVCSSCLLFAMARGIDVQLPLLAVGGGACVQSNSCCEQHTLAAPRSCKVGGGEGSSAKTSRKLRGSSVE